jgi:hypothetical protein
VAVGDPVAAEPGEVGSGEFFAWRGCDDECWVEAGDVVRWPGEIGENQLSGVVVPLIVNADCSPACGLSGFAPSAFAAK